MFNESGSHVGNKGGASAPTHHLRPPPPLQFHTVFSLIVGAGVG